MLFCKIFLYFWQNFPSVYYITVCLLRKVKQTWPWQYYTINKSLFIIICSIFINRKISKTFCWFKVTHLFIILFFEILIGCNFVVHMVSGDFIWKHYTLDISICKCCVHNYIVWLGSVGCVFANDTLSSSVHSNAICFPGSECCYHDTSSTCWCLFSFCGVSFMNWSMLCKLI